MRAKITYCLLVILCASNFAFGQQYANNEEDTPRRVNYYHEINIVSDKLKSDPTNIDLLDERAMLYMRVREFEKALEDIDKAIGIAPTKSELRYTKALILTQRERYDDAMEVINEAIAIDGKREEYFFFRARLYAFQEDYRNAIHDIDVMLGLNPHCDYCYLQKAIWCKKLNMFYEEIRNYLFYLELSDDEANKKLVEKRIKNLRKSDKYFNDLYKAAKKDIRKNGYPWQYKIWNK
ncbi:MAG: hypothetical protein C0592_14195 [Marinilabiliales bacterium]|nr:MAG: hypothetical protein C0592_14195 [Marinilabiliales bacterium]